MADQNKTEPCTAKKRAEARQKGEVARSLEMSAAVNLFSGLAITFVLGRYLFQVFHGVMENVFQAVGRAPLGEADAWQVLHTTGLQLFWIILPILLVTLAASLTVNYSQVGFMITPQALQVKGSKINPANGWKRIASTRSWGELIKSLAKILLASVIVWLGVKSKLPHLLELTGAPLAAGLAEAARLIWDVIWRLCVFFLAIGIADWVWQRHEFEKNMRMTKQEVKDEYRQAEGDQQIKSLRRSKHRNLARSRMAAEVARADVVTTNPTHYAVAMRYDQQKMRAPKVVAKGERLWAKAIVAVARKHRVPVIENKPLTRALFHSVEVGQEIPPKLYRTVAELLAALYKMRARRGKA